MAQLPGHDKANSELGGKSGRFDLLLPEFAEEYFADFLGGFRAVLEAMSLKRRKGGNEVAIAKGGEKSSMRVWISGFEEARMEKRIRFGLRGLAALFLQVSAFAATTNQAVLPLGLENSEGSTADSVFGGALERNVLISSGALPTAWSTPVKITAISFRTDGGHTFSFNAVVPRVEIRFSSSSKSPASMGPLFSDNAGPDALLAFAHDNVPLMSANGPGPNPFGLLFMLDQPFIYNPSAGNLLYNLKTFGSFGGGDIDAQGQGAGSFGTTAPGLITHPLFVMAVTQFSWEPIPEPNSIALLFTVFPIFLIAHKRSEWADGP
jgi:hypothetical protein